LQTKSKQLCAGGKHDQHVMEASSSDFEDLEPRLESEEDLLKSWSVLEKEVGKGSCHFLSFVEVFATLWSPLSLSFADEFVT